MKNNNSAVFEQMGNHFAINKSCYIWGTGKIANKLYEILKPLQCVLAFIDSNPENQNREIDGIPVISPYEKRAENSFVVIATTNPTFETDIYKTIFMTGGGEAYPYNHFVRNILPIFALYAYKKVYLWHLPLSVTEKCTLCCEKCNHLTAYNPSPVHHSLEVIKSDLDTYFKNVDFVILSLVLVGGELFLHPNVVEIVKYVCDKYNQRFASMEIITNGTIAPSQEMICLIKQYNISVSISDYRYNIPSIRDKVNAVIQFFNSNGIQPEINMPEEWTDYDIGNAMLPEDCDYEHHFDRCNYHCRYLIDKKLYFCTTDYMAQKVGVLPEDDDSYIDLRNGDDTFEWKKRLVMFDYGFVNEQGYLDACKSCYGGFTISPKKIPVGIQMEKK